MSIQASPSSPVIIVDEQDDNVVYKGAWNHGDAASDILFGGTGSYSEEAGPSANFTFVGSYIAVYAQVDSGELSVVDFSLDDGAQKGSYNSSTFTGDTIDGYHVLVWESTHNLEDKNHSLVITQQAGDFRPGVVIDFFAYTPTENTKMDEQTAFFVDDRDPGIIYGETGWNTYDLAVPPINHTLSYTNGPGCELTYTFQGTGISMYGMLDASDHGGTTLDLEVTVDDQAPTQFQPPLPSSSFNYGNRYFLLKDLEYGNHTVKVKNTNNETVEFDYFLVTPGTAPLTLTASTSTTPSATNTPDPVAKDADKRSTPVGAIVGGVMGGLVLLGLIGAFLVWMKRRNRKAQQRVYHSEEDLIPHTEPFPYSAAPSGQQASGTSPISAGQKRHLNLTSNTSGVPSQGRKGEKSAYAQTETSSAPSPNSAGESSSAWRSTTTPVSAGLTPAPVAPNVTLSPNARASVVPSAHGTDGTSSAEPYVDRGIRFDSRPPPTYTEA